jgi:hypothetical protein
MRDLQHKRPRFPGASRLQVLDLIGRDGEIRTRDPLNPIQVRYQAALRPDLASGRGHPVILPQIWMG